MSVKLSSVAWAVPPGSHALTRPARLVDGLRDLGVLPSSVRYIHHGRTASTPSSTNVGRLVPRIPRGLDAYAQLSPVFLTADGSPSPRWIDFYDDWSIAPDLSANQRMLSRLMYKRVSSSPAETVVTVNSEYMRRKLGLPQSAIVPNGVDEPMGALATTGDTRRRLLVFGKFFRGRTDWRLVRRSIMSGAFDEVVVGGLSKDDKAASALTGWAASAGAKLQIESWIGVEQLASLAGPRTAALVPHLVSDYTLSQDPMKIYTFLALGVRVIVPRMLWPRHLDPTYAYLTDYGMELAATIGDWLATNSPSREWRHEFAHKNSWLTRAGQIADRLV